MRENVVAKVLTVTMIVVVVITVTSTVLVAFIGDMLRQNANPINGSSVQPTITQPAVPEVDSAPENPAPTVDPTEIPVEVPTETPESSMAGVTVVDTLNYDGTYERDAFGSGWFDADSNGCDTRNDVLARDMVDETFLEGTCKVNTGVLNDPYTGTTIQFQYGKLTSSEVQIDHIVALENSWYAGAKNWTDEERAMFSNDPENLLAVDGATNSSKGADSPAQWMPTNSAYACTYVEKYANIIVKYNLSINTENLNFIENTLSNC